MGKVINFPTKNMAKVYIIIEHTEDFLVLEKNVSEFVKKLPISNDDSDKLIKLISAQIQQAEKDSFEQGFGVGLQIAEYLQE